MIYENKADHSKSTLAYYDLYDFKRLLKVQSV